jgi:hypothetical protein
VAKYSPTGDYLWAKRFGSTANDSANAVAVDSAGNIIVVGDFTGTVDFGGSALTSINGSSDIFIMKLSSAGVHQWSSRFGSGGSDSAYGVAVGNSGSVVMTGSYLGNVTFGGGYLNTGGQTNTFIAKFSSGGVHEWSTYLLSYYLNRGYGVTVDNGGNVVVTGYFEGTAYLGGAGGSQLTNATGTADIYLLKLSSTGGLLWSRNFGSSAVGEIPYSVAVDGVGNIVITGNYADGLMDFGGGQLPSAIGSNIFVAKFSSGGSHIWSKGFLTSGRGTGVAVDGSGNVVVTGYFQQAVDLGSGLLTSNGGYDIFVAKYASTNGASMWVDHIGNTGHEAGNGVAVDGANGNIVNTGYFQLTVDFGTELLTSAGGQDIYLLNLQP